MTTKSEVLRIPRSARLRAFGLWAMAGAWSAKELSDGHIPEHMLEELAGTPADAQWLVDVGLWCVAGDGWQFVEWAPVQPLRAKVLEDREKSSQRVKDFRHRNSASNAVTNSVTNDATNTDVAAAPTLPYPSHPNNEEHVQDKPARDYSEEFIEFWSVYPRKQAKPDAWKAYKAALKSADATTIFAGAQAYALLNIGEDKQFLKLPAGWLRDERWDDEQIPPSQDNAPEIPEVRARRILADFCAVPGHEGYPRSPVCYACERAAGEQGSAVA